MINKDMMLDEYSEEEVKTNKVWLDGKPIYRRCYKIGAIAKDYELGISAPADVKDAIFLDGFGITAAGQYIGLNFNNVDFADYKSFAYYRKQGNLIYTKAKFERVNALIVFEYTKTTD